ncbi:unnamed protein product [Miscanthus lutarioriparius]|nr:unnamed protein product [Miscanthus lutarioriparius]
MATYPAIAPSDGLFLRCTHTCFLSSKVQSPYAETLEPRRSALQDDFEEEEEDKEDAHSLTLYSEYMTSRFTFPIIPMLHSTNCFQQQQQQQQQIAFISLDLW